MKKNIKKIGYILLILGILISQFMGCTAIGFALGAASDARKPDYKYCSIKILSNKIKGSNIKVIKKNGQELQGKLIGLEKRDEKEYLEVYNQCRGNGDNESIFPALGRISLYITSTGKQFNYQLTGIDYDGIIVRKAGSTGCAKKSFVLLKGTELIDCEANKISIASLERLVTIGEIPVISALKLQTASGEINIDPGEIAMIQVPNKKNGKIKGLLHGAMIDAAILIILSLSKPFEFEWGSDLSWQ
jgi:hypothetical protein